MWSAFKALSLGSKIFVLAAILALFGATYYVSYNKGLNVSKVEIANYKAESAKKTSERATTQAKTDVKYVIQYKDRVQYVDRVVTKTRTVVEQNVPEQFNLSRGWIYAYNQSVRGLELDPTLAADKTPSSVSEMRVLADTIIPNNGVSLSTKAQLEALQAWIRESNENISKINAGR